MPANPQLQMHDSAPQGSGRPSRSLSVGGEPCRVLCVPLTQGQAAQIDAQDDWVLQHKWYAQRQRGGNYYAGRGVYEGGKRVRTEWLHVVILGRMDGFIIDHKNGDTLDCRRGNLRYATQSQNRANSRKRRDGGCHYLGVYFDKRRNRYIGKCSRDYVSYSTAYFKTALAAAHARDELAKRLHGMYCRLNCP